MPSLLKSELFAGGVTAPDTNCTPRNAVDVGAVARTIAVAEASVSVTVMRLLAEV
jgi:hypothetical protein